MKLYLRLAWRNMWRHRRRTLIVILAMGLTLAMMMLYDGLVAGFDQAIYGNAIKVLGGNIQIHAIGYSDKTDQNPLLPLDDDQAVVKAALSQPQVVAAARRITTVGMATDRKGAFGVSIVGIEPQVEQPVSILSQHIVSGRYLTAADQDVAFIGKGLADAMELKVGDRFTLVGRATHQQMRQRTMTVGGIYDLGMPDIEKQDVYISLGEAQDLYGLTGKVTEVALSLKQLGQEQAVMKALKPALANYELSDWQTNFPELQQALDRKGSIMNIFSVIILFIAGIGILNLLLMAVYERTREIGLLGALGMKPRQISDLFLLEGALMGLVGAAFGVVLGIAINFLLGRVGFDYTSMASLTQYMALITGRVYPTLGLNQLYQRVPTVIIIAILASYYPAHEAAKNEPAQALHYV
jgi:putative ABC transport system permease protein